MENMTEIAPRIVVDPAVLRANRSANPLTAPPVFHPL